MVGQRYHTLARAVHAQGRLEEAEGLFRRAWEILAAALPEGHVNLAYPMTELGQVLTEQGRAREAEPILREALELRTRGFPEGHVRIAEARSALGAALTELGRRQEAERLLVSALEVLRDDPGAAGLASLTAARLEANRSGTEDGGSG
jgi:tetratricopeptide (TPR) repeat protein